ncbi:MAG: hypothetical protein LBT39_09765, partial [Treponema sp.]|nr:hypothetical protein [Treponema sp.]
MKVYAFALVLAFGLALTGCPDLNGGGDGGNGGGGGGGPYEDPVAAAKLAADINAIKPGSAELSGAKVTIIDDVGIENGLTVPEGVTLDVTADGAALTLRDSTLTVNGKVNAGPQYIRLDDTASLATINGSGTIHLTGQGNLLRARSGKKLTLDGVTLAGLNNNSAPLVTIENGGEFVLKSGAITGNTRVSNEWAVGGGVYVGEGGLLTMEGGTISGNTASGANAGGGGVWVNGGTFVMIDGTISGNTVTSGGSSLGGGVYVWDEGFFTMQDGTISGNTATSSGTDGSSSGGGVGMDGGSEFIMEGGTISGNTATGGRYGGGGGVGVSDEDSTFTMKDGT